LEDILQSLEGQECQQEMTRPPAKWNPLRQPRFEDEGAELKAEILHKVERSMLSLRHQQIFEDRLAEK
jgi:hypothetical protein